MKPVLTLALLTLCTPIVLALLMLQYPARVLGRTAQFTTGAAAIALIYAIADLAGKGDRVHAVVRSVVQAAMPDRAQ